MVRRSSQGAAQLSGSGVVLRVRRSSQGAAKLRGFGVAQMVMRRLAQLLNSARHPREVTPSETTAMKKLEMGLSVCL
jgi:hypothetical protein